MEVVLSDVLVASQQLTDLGTDYGTAVGTMSGVSTGSSEIFENGDVSGPWSDVVNTIWGYLADSQDNCNDTGRTLIRYINAMCEEDGANATELSNAVKEYNGALDATEDGQGDDVGDPLPEPDLSDPDQVIDEPVYEDAERPPGGP